MRRFTIAPERITGDRVAFDRDETLHLARVLRLGPGDIVIAADGRGHDYTVRIETLGDTATATVIGMAANRSESPLAITLVQGIPKSDRMELVVRAATELGVVRVCPAIALRTVVRLEPSRWRERARRWQRVAREAAKQCGRAVVPEVDTPRPLQEWLPALKDADTAVCLWEGHAPPLASVVRPELRPRTAVAVVGPEGGLAREEVEQARGLGYRLVSLGPRILRTETAGPATVALLQYVFGDLGHRGRE